MEVEAIVNHTVSDNMKNGRDKEELTSGCIKQLLRSYVEGTH